MIPFIDLPKVRPYQIISFATEGSEYVECCYQQAELFGHSYSAYLLENTGSWESNTRLKPKVIKHALNMFKSVLWVDADCELDPPDQLPNKQFDIGVIDNINTNHSARISAATILFNRTALTTLFIRQWLARCNYSKRDHPAFMYALSLNQAKIANITPWLEGRHTYNSLLPVSNWRPNRGVFYG